MKRGNKAQWAREERERTQFPSSKWVVGEIGEYCGREGIEGDSEKVRRDPSICSA